MKSKVMLRALSGALAIALGLALGGCGGGGGSSASAPIVLSGTAVAGIFKNADVKVYDATKVETGTPIATTTTGSDGKYSVTLPAGFASPVLVIVSAKATGSSVLDEVFGETPVTSGFTLRSVIPSDAISEGALPGHVTPYTNLMYEIVKNKIGQSDVNAAINQARNVVNQITGNVDPLNTDPVTDPAMVVKLAAVSNIANGNDATNDPDNCRSEPTNGEKLACSIATLGKLVAPMAGNAPTTGDNPLALDTDRVAALKDATDSLDIATVATNTGLATNDLNAKKTETSNKLADLPTGPDATLTAPSSAVASGIQQAKEFFANLRTGILPYANDDETGFLNMEGNNLQTEVDQLTMASVGGFDLVAEIAEFAIEMHDGTLPDRCTGSAVSATCFVDGVQILMTGSGTAWSMSNGALTGTISFNSAGTELTMNGYILGMTTGATKAKVGNPDNDSLDTPLKLTRTAIVGQTDMYRYTLAGSLKDLKNCANNVCTPVLKLDFGGGSYFDIHEPDVGDDDITKMSASFTGTFITANYRFIGQLGVSDVQEKNRTPPNWGSEVVSGTANFTGTINGTGLTSVDSVATNDFNLLVGKLEATVNGASYDPFIDDSASNFQTGSMTFTGTVFKSASDPGLKLVMTMAQTGWEKGTLTVAYNDYNKGISLTGSGTYDDNNSETQYITLSEANGISVKIGDNRTTQVMKGATKLADIDNNRVTYMDGTFESLL